MTQLSDFTKQELVDMINDLPGDNVTTRPRKSTLIEIYEQRAIDAMMADMAEIEAEERKQMPPRPDMAELDGPRPHEPAATGAKWFFSGLIAVILVVTYLAT